MPVDFRSVLPACSKTVVTTLSCVAFCFGAPAPAAADDGGWRTERSNDVMALGQSRLMLSIGDKVKLNVFEQLGGLEDQASKNSNLIERVEMSGEYTVQADGNLYVPLLGAHEVHGKPMAEALAELEKAFQDAFGKEGRVTLAITARSPVYVVGRVARPGTYDHTGGMTVLHALAQAGGLERPLNSELYDVVREQKKMEEGQDKQRRIVARLEVLGAERAGVPPQPSAKLVGLAGEREALALMSEQQNMRALASEARSIKLKGLDATIAAATRELAIQREKKEKMEENSSAKEQRVAVLQQLSLKGNGGSYQMLQAKSEFGDFQERLSEVQVVISQVEDRLVQAQNEKSRIITESRLDLERDIAAVEEQSAEIAHNIATSAQLVLLARQASRDQPPSHDNVRFEIVRMTPHGPRTMEAGETVTLMPGDLVKVQPFGEQPYGAASMMLPTN